jgi:hypothetical protein
MASDLQLALILLVVIAGLLLFRVFFAREVTYHDLHADALARRTEGDSTAAPVSSDVGRVRVTAFNFTHFDAVPGPPEPEVFADELIVELYDSVSDFRWTATYVVATPAGIRKMMDDERWSFFYATEIFIVRRYDLQTIREAVYGRIKEIHDQVPLGPEEPPRIG